MGRRTFAVVSIAAVLMGLALAASAHADGGVDEPWTVEMNQETYWELRFGPGAECTKYEPHNGSIPSQYEAAVSKGGTEVRVYMDPPSQITGPHRDNGTHINISWVMKCNIETDTTTTLATTTTTTTVASSSTTTTPTEITSTTEPSVTTSTVTDSTTTSTTELPATTTTAPTESTTTTQGPTTTSEPGTTSSVPDASARWTASGACYEDGGYIGVEWGDGITGVDVYMWADIDLGQTPAGWGNPGTRFLESGAYKTTVSVPTAFKLVAIAAPGYVADPAEIEVLVDSCTPVTTLASSTSAPEAPQTPATPDLEELPYTGLPLHVWAILGLMAMGTGAFLVRRFSE